MVTQRMEYKERGEEREVGRAADSCLNFKEKLMIHLGGGFTVMILTEQHQNPSQGGGDVTKEKQQHYLPLVPEGSR